MSTENVEVFNRYYGNGVATQFSIGFPYLKREFVKVYLYKKDTDEEKVLNSDQFSFVNDSIIQYPVLPTDEILKEGDIITIQRETELGSEFEFDNQRRLFPVEVMNADDLAFQQIQELSREIKRAVRVNPTASETPEELLQTVYDKLDSATEIAGDAISAANQAQTAADNATAAVNSAEQTLANVTAYVTSAKVDIDNTKNTAINTINSTVAQAKSDINTAVSNAESNISTIVSDAEGSITNIAVTEANKAIANAAQEATDTATANLNSYVDSTVKPSLQTYVDQAQENANSAATSMEQAALSATAASNSASSASADADNAAESAGLAANSATAAATSKTNAKIWADGTDSEVQALGGVHSSKGWSEAAQAVVEGKQDIANLSQTLDNSTTKYPSNKAVKTAIDAKDSLPSQSGQSGKFLTTNGTTASWADVGGGLEIGDIGFAPLGIDEAQNKRRYLNGQVISQAQFVSFTNKIKAAIQLYPSIATTETNWQAEVTNSKLGQCGKFVIDNTAGTIRLPKVVNINGLQDLALMGSIKAESLPNITGEFSATRASGSDTTSGAFTQSENLINSATGTGKYGRTYNFDASRSSSTYKDNAPVQQEAIQYPYFIQVATGVEESIDVTREIELNNPFSLLDYKWSEYELNNASWLLSNGQFNSGATYVAVYELLLKIHNGTETKDGVSVKLSTEAYTDTDFVINTADTTFRLPIKVKLASGNRVAGNGMTLGFTDGTNNYGLLPTNNNPNNYLFQVGVYGTTAGSSGNGSVASENKSLGVTTDPTKSGIETSSSGLKLYFYVGETIQDANVIAASQVLTKVANGIDRTVASDRETVVGWGMPDYSAGIAINAKTYTAPKAGIVLINCQHADHATNQVTINGVQLYSVSMNGSYAAGTLPPFETQVSAGDVITSNQNILNFYPYKGA